MLKRLVVVLALALPCPALAQDPLYRNPDAPLTARVTDLVGRMTLEEKISQLMDVAPAIDRLGVPEYNWWNEALHGVARSGLATVFPQAIGLAATWNDSLMYQLATVISDEARAKHHEYVRNGKRLRYQGLTIWSPNINLFRDPRWGRGQETYGEDPVLTGRMGVQFIRGLQGDDPKYLKTVSTVKHFAVHSGPEPARHTFDAVVSERDLRETYLPHFEAGIRQGGAYSVMCAYNRVFGKPACASDLLLQKILRGEWGFNGYVVSDCGAINDISERHKVVATAAEAAARALATGTDLECGRVYQNLLEAVQKKLLSESVIDTAVTRLFTARFRLGMFDPVERVKYAQIPYSVLDNAAHRALARKVAQQSMVLLKNEGNVLPLRKDLGSIAVIGPNADDRMMLLGNYNGMPADPVTPLRGIREAVGPKTRVLYARGSELADSFATYDVVPASALRNLHAEYFGNRNLGGRPLFTGRDSTIDADWRDKAPRAGMDPDDFGVRWTGTIKPPRSGVYQIGLLGTMKFELYLDDSLVVRSVYNYRDEFGDPRLRTTLPLQLQAGRSYRVRVEGHESYGDAQLQLMWTQPRVDLTAEAVAAAQKADAVVLFLGLTPRLEGEEMDVAITGFSGGDRTSLDLPSAQQRLLERVAAVGKPTVLVLLSGSALSVNWAQQHVPAILEAWYPGQAAGSAIADVLFGDYNPGGRLPVTFYQSVNDLPDFSDYSMHGRTYRFFNGKSLYPFGHGLSYTSFAYSNLVASSKTLSKDGAVTLRVNVRNSGARAGDEVVQLYVQHLGSAVERPRQELKDYQRITLQPGETRTVSFTLEAAKLAYWDSAADKWTVENDRVRVMVGSSSSDIKLSDTLTVAGETQTLRPAGIFTDGIVLQRGAPIPVWGWSAPNASVSVSLAGNTRSASADANGRWSVQLPALPAGGRYQLVVQSGAERVVRGDVTIGDVWIASGQSNMEWPLERASNGAEAVAAANDADLREFFVPHAWADSALQDIKGGPWYKADPQHAGSFSAVGYFFAKELRASQKVPIGIVHTSWGGSNVETWISRNAQAIGDAAWQKILRDEEQYYQHMRDSLRVKLGDIPTQDAGLVGDRAVWADPALNDSGWATINVPGLWETQGYDGLDGVAWYRLGFTLTEAEAKQPARVSLGPIDDDEITWINGTEIGRTSGYTKIRNYQVPAGVLRPGRNVITFRVTDGGGGGGAWGEASQYDLDLGGAHRSLAGPWKFKVGAASLGPNGQRINKIPSALYNAMIHPLLRFPIKGAIWYQGESNANSVEQAQAYRALFAKLIQSWRNEWQAPQHDFPFFWVQLPNFGTPDTVPPVQSAWAALRDAQSAALALPNTGQAVIIDLGDPGDIHPRNKLPVGQRLALQARNVAYGEKLVASGPTYRRQTIAGRSIRVAFDNVGAGLVAKSGTTVCGFTIAGADRKFVPATARITGNTVVVESPNVRAPVAVRYAWSNSPPCAGLYNREGLAARPFRTDDW